jgi:hypothetical protein
VITDAACVANALALFFFFKKRKRKHAAGPKIGKNEDRSAQKSYDRLKAERSK